MGRRETRDIGGRKCVQRKCDDVLVNLKSIMNIVVATVFKLKKLFSIEKYIRKILVSKLQF